jgi:hypothetical protein
MAWKSSEDGTWHKELGGVEKIYRFQSTIFRATGREHWGLYTTCKVKLETTLSEDADAAPTLLRNAWKALRLEFPGLTLVVDGYEAVYPGPGRDMDGLSDEEKTNAVANAVEEWAQKTFRVEPTLIVEQILANYQVRDLPGLIWLPETSEILFLTSHWRVDGLGSCMLLNRLFELVAANASGVPPGNWSVENELAKISPSLEDAAGSPMTPTPEIENTAKEISTTFREKALASIGLPYNGDRTTPPGNPAVQAIGFTEESSKSLVGACKERKISVSAAIHAALAATTFEMTSAKDVNEYVTIMAVSYRPYLKEPYNSEAHACRTYVSSIPPVVPKNATFEEQTTSLTQLFKNWHTEKMSQALRELYRGASQALVSPRPGPPPGPPPNPPSGITHSNLGVIDQFIHRQYYGDAESKTPAVEVTRFGFGVSVLTRQMLLYPWTFRGQLNLSINYNDAYYEAKVPLLVLDRVQQKLEEELRINLERSA